MVCWPYLRMWTDSLILLVGRSGSLSITVAFAQSITWFSWIAWSVRVGLLCSERLAVRWHLVKVRLVLESTSTWVSSSVLPWLSVTKVWLHRSRVLTTLTLCYTGLWDSKFSHQPSHVYDRFLDMTAGHRVKIHKNRVPASLRWRPLKEVETSKVSNFILVV